MKALTQTEREQIKRQFVLDRLAQIENKTQIMAHEDPRIKDKLKQWQDDKLPTGYFLNTLSKYLDDLCT